MRRVWLASVVATAAAIAIPSSASAATTIGSTFEPETGCGVSLTRLQSGSPGDQYAAPSDGVITSWSFQAAATPPDLRFKVARAAPGADLTMNANFTIVGQSVLETNLTANALNSFLTRIPVLKGDVIGFYNATTPGGPCQRTPDGYPFHSNSNDVQPGDTQEFIFDPGVQLPLSALLEPDCDQDGLGDETQDSDTSSQPCRCLDAQVTIRGTDGPEEITGTEGPDVIAALGGNDQVGSLGGNDLVCGGSGRDSLRGGKNKDKLLGQSGKDTLRGQGGKDRLLGKGGKDKLNGGTGKDVCKGGKKDDTAKKCEVEKSI